MNMHLLDGQKKIGRFSMMCNEKTAKLDAFTRVNIHFGPAGRLAGPEMTIRQVFLSEYPCRRLSVSLLLFIR